MRKRMMKPAAVLCSAMLLGQGCGWLERHKGAVIGAGVGAVAGGVVGHAVRGRKGAVVGALAGALVGGAIGAYLDSRNKTAAETNQTYSYAPAQGTRVELASVAADPNSVAPGGKVYLQATYAVMTPNTSQQLAITETRVITLGGAEVARLNSDVVRAPGTYTSQVPIDLRPDAARGRYELTIIIAAAGKTAQGTSYFVVN
jgi:surface antigen